MYIMTQYTNDLTIGTKNRWKFYVFCDKNYGSMIEPL